jgi:hypothetical protein
VPRGRSCAFRPSVRSTQSAAHLEAKQLSRAVCWCGPWLPSALPTRCGDVSACACARVRTCVQNWESGTRACRLWARGFVRG